MCVAMCPLVMCCVCGLIWERPTTSAHNEKEKKLQKLLALVCACSSISLLSLPIHTLALMTLLSLSYCLSLSFLFPVPPPPSPFAFHGRGQFPHVGHGEDVGMEHGEGGRHGCVRVCVCVVGMVSCVWPGCGAACA